MADVTEKDVVIRSRLSLEGIEFVVADATARLIAGPFHQLADALRAARTHISDTGGEVLYAPVDERGRATGDPMRLQPAIT